jgi:diadenylate cyclase
MDSLLQSLSGLRWQDIFDILLNSYILFRLYVLFRGTKIIRMLVAICILWILERMAMSIGLIVTSWAIQGIIAAAALIIIIVFRNEIGSVFRVSNFQSFFWGIPRRQVQPPIEIITESVYELARHKLGALIVLPLKKGLEDVVHGGVLWQGRLSREMLLSIFWHGTPVHDGAIVIQGDQVVEVSTILPLSKNKDLPSHFGTRHRAAAGLTEQTDALVLVVSEERGEVTLFKDKSIINIKDSIELNRVLRQYTDTAPTTNGAKKLTVELFFAAMICLAGVTGIWFSFARGVETLATLEVPVEFVNRNPKMEIFSASASSVKLQISGSGSLIRNVRPDQVKVKLDLANAVAGNNQVAITRDGIVLPPGIQLKQLEPQAIEVNFDVAVHKKLSIQPEWTGKLPADFILQDAYTVPERVEVVGGNLTLKGLRTIYTEKIPLENITSDGQVSVTLVLLPSSLKLADESQKHAKVIYKIGQRAPASDAEGK